MYFPYMYGRGAELSAIRTSARLFGDRGAITPVLEPALKPDGQLDPYVRQFSRTIDELRNNKASAYVIANPHQGIFTSDEDVSAWQSQMLLVYSDSSVVKPTFKVTSRTVSSEVTEFAQQYSGQEMGLVVADENAVTAADLATPFQDESVRVFLLPGVDSNAYITAFEGNGILRVKESFRAQARNADYAGTEHFTSDHLPVNESDGAVDFSDFTVLPSTMSFTGGRTGAAVIHLTYVTDNGSFWIEHFVSDVVDIKQGTFQSKLLEAIEHMHAALRADPTRFEPTGTIGDYLTQRTTGQATSQGKNKQLQIEHHLQLVANRT